MCIFVVDYLPIFLCKTSVFQAQVKHAYQSLACETVIDTENPSEVFPVLKKRSQRVNKMHTGSRFESSSFSEMHL